jgi:transcription initiation factor TFIIB
MSCKSNNVPRSAREVAKMFNLNISVMTKGCKKFHELMKISTESTSPHHFIHRYCSRLECNDIKNVCLYAVNKVAEHCFVSENAPSSIAAACIYMVCNICKKKISKKSIAQSCDISEVTINKCYNKLYTYRGVILPAEFIFEYNVL